MFVGVVADLSGNYVRDLRFSYVHEVGAGFPKVEETIIVLTQNNEQMKKLTLTMFCILASIMCAKAQIGYQISLLNTATGEPRANETVTVTVSLSNSEGKVFYSETKSATTNDFGVLSLSIGNADMFKEVDLTKMPFFIEATANGVMIGKSQILNVPTAEVAKRLAPAIDINELIGTWKAPNYYYSEQFVACGNRCLTFYENGTGVFSEDGSVYGVDISRNFEYSCEGNHIYIYVSEGGLQAVPGDGGRQYNTIFVPYIITVSLHNGKLLEVGSVCSRFYHTCYSYTKQ